MKYLIPSTEALRCISAIEAADNGVIPVSVSSNGRVLHVIVQRRTRGRAEEYMAKMRGQKRVVVDDYVSPRIFARALVGFYRLEEI